MTEADSAIRGPPLAKIIRTAMPHGIAAHRQPAAVPHGYPRCDAYDPTHLGPDRLATTGHEMALVKYRHITESGRIKPGSNSARCLWVVVGWCEHIERV